MLRKTILLLGNEAPAIYKNLCKDKEAKTSGLPEKDSHKDKFSTLQFVEINHGVHEYKIICASPDVLEYAKNKYALKRLAEERTIESVSCVVFCVKSLRDKNDAELTQVKAQYDSFKKTYGSPEKEPDIVYTTPDQQLQLSHLTSNVIRFLNGCRYHKDAVLKKFSSHFNTGATAVKTEVQEDKESVASLRMGAKASD